MKYFGSVREIFAQMLPVYRSKAKYLKEKHNESTSSTGSISGLYTADTARTRSISSFCTVNTAILTVRPGLILRILPVLQVLWGSILWLPPVIQVFRDPALLILRVLAVHRPSVLQKSQYSPYEKYFGVYSEYEVCWKCLTYL